MMQVTFQQFAEDEADALIDLITSETWDYFVHTNPTPEVVRDWLARGWYSGDDNLVWWIVGVSGERAGIVRMHDLLDPTPQLDFRIRAQYRGQGIGVQALRWATEYLFTTLPEIQRIEGNTRQDNLAMRKTFRRCGYVKEAHYRSAWPTLDGARFDTIGYAILRQDWQSGTSTAVAWDDEPE
ncbi:MAG TPA: GNAT family N-acetyltransferase [Herpetosiphonaceae bacterium]